MNELTPTYAKAVDLDRRIKVSAQLAQKSLYDMCMGFKEMRDSKLYRELGYSDFGDYCENETGFKRRQVYTYISVCENLPKDFVQSTAQIGVQKLALLAKLDEPERAEIIEKTDVDNVTVKELEAKIKELKIKADKADNLKKLADNLSADREHIGEQRDKAITERDEALKAKQELAEQLEQAKFDADSERSKIMAECEEKYAPMRALNKDLITQWGEANRKIEELENRPVEVAVQDNSEEIEKLKTQYEQEIEAMKAEYSKRISEAESNPVADVKEVFKAHLMNAVDSAKRLIKFVNKNPDETFKAKALEFFAMLNTNLKNNGE